MIDGRMPSEVAFMKSFQSTPAAAAAELMAMNGKIVAAWRSKTIG